MTRIIKSFPSGHQLLPGDHPGMIVAGGFSVIDGFARIFSMNLVAVSLIFFLVIGLAFRSYKHSVQLVRYLCNEKKYGFNTMTVRTFITDHIKSWFIALLVGIPVLGLLHGSITRLVLPSGFMLDPYYNIFVFMNYFYSELIVSAFHKQLHWKRLPEEQDRRVCQ